MTQLLKDQVCLVTGASRGIGKAIATAIAGEGAVVFGTATTENGANSISEYLSAAGSAGRGLVLNVTDPESISDVVSTVMEEAATPTFLVNNAGIT